MNPWWKDFKKRLRAEHDNYCEDGPRCATRDEHVEMAYVVPALRNAVNRLPYVQRALVRGEELPRNGPKGDAAVEAGARAMFYADREAGNWDAAFEFTRAEYRDRSRAVVRAIHGEVS